MRTRMFVKWLHIILLSWLILQANSVQIHTCQRRCGNISIEYPFGMMSKECYFNKGFEVSCRNSSGTERAFLTSVNLELLYIDKYRYTVSVNLPVFSSNCGNNRSQAQGVDLSGSPFTFGDFYNTFTAVGCNNYAEIMGRNFEAIGGCLSTCSSGPNSSSVSAGCQTTIPPHLKFFNASVSNYRPSFCQTNNNNSEPDQECRSAFMIAKDSLSFLYQVPAMLEWGRYIGSCFETKKHQNESWVTLSERHLCRCEGISVNELLCQGGSAAFGMLFLIIGTWRLYKFLKRKKEIKLKQKLFKRNGGLLLQQKLFSNEGNLENTKLFTSKKLEKATDNYDANRIIGQGGQGTVFKGMLTDGRIVAIKKSKIMYESSVEQFINEVVILSQINHRNVVKLLGCCLETDIPLLVYEFIPNGTLYRYIHDQTEEFPITWEMRLRIAIEVANALSYMHSAASIPIYHRDIKSTNILLDDKYRAKVSDFGTSRSIAIDQTHLTTQVKGTFGYFDPKYFRSSQFTDKSDVYSFGVVLVELLTGQKPIRSSTNLNEVISLASYFVYAMKEKRLFEALDARVLKEGGKEEITTFANIAKRCLQSNGKKRPTMREVASELESIKTSNGNSILHPFPGNEEVEYFDGDITEHFETSTSSFTGS
ncbi:hypothetical protein JRO89_XS04G0009000 [Xanthoceras sorbifolium]|uniref:Protein kinase domain-containing protein n=1 Tax=Xanthoceras sorbifolium TaxID=99658 RepID=A0ABQ8I3M2_9ROSI|nr:hypothetical protein JRO89_XS04G0009000 [Xanthoceras sorbifolium]